MAMTEVTNEADTRYVNDFAQAVYPSCRGGYMFLPPLAVTLDLVLSAAYTLCLSRHVY